MFSATRSGWIPTGLHPLDYPYDAHSSSLAILMCTPRLASPLILSISIHTVSILHRSCRLLCQNRPKSLLLSCLTTWNLQIIDQSPHCLLSHFIITQIPLLRSPYSSISSFPSLFSFISSLMLICGSLSNSFSSFTGWVAFWGLYFGFPLAPFLPF